MIYLLIPVILLCSDTADVHAIIRSRRSIRKFKQEAVSLETIKEVCNDARFAPSPGNLQPWEFLIVHNQELTDKLFNHLEWLGDTPEKDEVPVAYIVLLIPKEFNKDWSCLACLGACSQNILLSAWSYGIGSCWIGSIKNKKGLKKLLKIPESFDIFSIIALGYPAEKPVIVESKDNTKPYRDTDGKMHVPKKPLFEILHINHYGWNYE